MQYETGFVCSIHSQVCQLHCKQTCILVDFQSCNCTQLMPISSYKNTLFVMDVELESKMRIGLLFFWPLLLYTFSDSHNRKQPMCPEHYSFGGGPLSGLLPADAHCTMPCLNCLISPTIPWLASGKTQSVCNEVHTQLSLANAFGHQQLTVNINNALGKSSFQGWLDPSIYCMLKSSINSLVLSLQCRSNRCSQTMFKQCQFLGSLPGMPGNTPPNQGV